MKISGMSISEKGIMYAAGSFTLLLGVLGTTGILGAGVGGERLVYGLAVLCGLVILSATSLRIIVAKYFTCLVTVLLASLSLSSDPRGESLLAYAFSIALAGVLIGGEAIPWITALSLLGYFAAVGLGGHFGDLDPSNYLTVVVVLALVAALLTYFANTQRHTAAEAVANATEAKRALVNEQAGAAREGEAKVAVGGLARNLAASSEQQQGAANTASSAAAEISSQTTELASAAEQIAESASRAKSSSEQATRRAEDAGKSLAANREQLNRAVVASEQMQTAARQVEISVARVGQTLALISEIAADTHLLSLNATIEAAGAGTAGKRFAVVASEVGKLANKVNGAVEEIGELNSGMQRTVQLMSRDVNEALGSVRESQAASGATEEQIKVLLGQLDEVLHEIYRISSSTEQQRRATSQIAGSMGDLTTVSSQAASLSGQLADIARRLSEAAGRLTGTLTGRIAP